MKQESYPKFTMFQWPDYFVFSIALSFSAAIGFYYACTGGKQRTTREYLLADKNMHWLPVAASLFARYDFLPLHIELNGNQSKFLLNYKLTKSIMALVRLQVTRQYKLDYIDANRKKLVSEKL